MTKNLKDTVRSLIKPKAGYDEKASERDRAIAMESIREYRKQQQVRIYIVAVFVLLLLLAPILFLFYLPGDRLLIAMGTTGIFTIAGLTMFVNLYRDLCHASTLLTACETLDSKHVQELFTAWLAKA